MNQWGNSLLPSQTLLHSLGNSQTSGVGGGGGINGPNQGGSTMSMPLSHDLIGDRYQRPSLTQEERYNQLLQQMQSSQTTQSSSSSSSSSSVNFDPAKWL